MARTFFLFTFYYLSLNGFSQGSLGPSNVIIPSNQPQSGVIDGVYEKKDVLSKKRAIPFEFVRENDYIWGKRTWSYIDLREKFNHPLYYPHEKIDANTGTIIEMPQGRYSLYYVLRMALLNGHIMGYRDQIIVDLNQRGQGLFDKKGGDDFSLPVQRNFSLPVSQDNQYRTDLGNGLIGVNNVEPREFDKTIGPDTVYHLAGVSSTDAKKYLKTDQIGPYTLDAATETIDKTKAESNGGLPIPVSYKFVSQAYYESKDIIKYILKEDWFFDKERSVMDVRIIGLAPVFKADTSKEETIIFWTYFPQVRDVLKNYYAYDTKNTVGGNTFDHVFMSRRFNSVIYKESTLYDRKIEDYRFGADALYESEKVKNDIRTVEHDVWNF
jgi:gliding motility associated protien GldN